MIYTTPIEFLPENYKKVLPITPNTIEIYSININPNNPFGYGIINYKNNEYSLEHLYISPEYRNMGYGQKLLKSIINEYNQLKLLVGKNNINALHIYKKLGFNKLYENKKYIIMDLKLK